MKSKMRLYLSCCLCLFLSNGFAATYTIGSSGDFPTLSAVSGIVTAGDSCVLQSQIFADGTQFWNNINGTPSAPIVIIAATAHQAIFQGGTEAIHLVDCSYIEINGLLIEQQTGNGINIDDGGDYSTPSTNITVRNCMFRNMGANGNHDFLKMSGVDHFLIENCSFTNGADGGSGIDFVGCHWGTVQDCYLDNAGVSGIQAKGGSQYIRIQRNVLKNMSQRALNLGGSTGLQFFRPPLSDLISGGFEAADLEVFSNVFIGNWAPIAYVGCVRVKVYNNTFYQPQNWVIRILQETTVPGFLACGNNEFRNNIVYQQTDLTEVNIGPNTDPNSFIFSNNVWYNASSNTWTPVLPVADTDQVIGDPFFVQPGAENFDLLPGSPAISSGISLGQPATDFLQMPFFDPPSSGAYEGATGTLAIEAIQLQARHEEEKIQLSWSPNNLSSFSFFEIEHARNHSSWQTLALVENRLSYIHENPQQGLNLYRVKAIYENQTLGFSNIELIDVKKEPEISIYPNPVDNFFQVKGTDQMETEMELYDLNGRFIQKIKSVKASIGISHLQAGVYIIKIPFGNYQVFKKIVKL